MNRINTNMRDSFMNCKVIRQSKLTDMIVNVLSTKAGTLPVGRGWSINASQKTMRKLMSEGCLR